MTTNRRRNNFKRQMIKATERHKTWVLIDQIRGMAILSLTVVLYFLA